jgi:DNA-binding CsgD family transcriptional regulator
MTSPDIGMKLGITERTVNFHFSNLFSKLGVLNRNEAIAKATAQGIVRPGA